MYLRRLPMILAIIAAFAGCRKFEIPIAPPVPKAPPTQTDSTTPSMPIPYVKGSWQCQIDGVSYSGSVDTSYTRYDSSHDQLHPDTVIFCTGTTTDKHANVHFQIDFNRYPVRNIPYFSTAVNAAQFDFDTCADNMLQAFYGSQSEVDFYIDSTYKDSLKAHFSGTLSYIGPNGVVPGHTITNGTFTAGWQGGNHDANSFVYTPSSNLATKFDGYDNAVIGYFNSATMVSNTLVLDGTPNNWSGQSKWQLQIRTGGTIKPGTYTSAEGDVGLLLYAPSVNRNFVYDSAGSLTVVITSVSGNTVHGNFSGTDQDGSSISTGSFAVRIKGYVPEADSLNKWGFGTLQSGNPSLVYHVYGGNILNAAFTSASGRYFLTLNGESDLGSSAFKFVVSSATPIGTGVYPTTPVYSGSENWADSIYFNSSALSWVGASSTLSNPTFVIIDSLAAHYVQGRFSSYPLQYGPTFSFSYIQQGKFSASF